MSCKIQYNNRGEMIGVLDENGRSSQLFSQIASNPHLSVEDALDIYKNIYTDKIEMQESFKTIKKFTSEDVEDFYYDMEEEAFTVIFKTGDDVQVYLDENASEQEIVDESLELINSIVEDLNIDARPTVYRGINGGFSSDRKGVQYFSVNPSYARVFGRNVESFKIDNSKVLNLDEWNSRLGIEDDMFGQGFLTIHQDNFTNLREYESRIYSKLLRNGVSQEEAESLSSYFIREFKSADVVYGEDIGNKGEYVYAVKDKSKVKPVNNISFSRARASTKKERGSALLQDLTNKLKKTGLASGVNLLSQVEIDTLMETMDMESSVKSSILDGDSTVKGFVLNGEVYINTEKATPDTAIHEFGHLWNEWAMQNTPSLYKKGVELVKKEGQKYIEYVKSTQPNLKGDDLYEEALAQAIGDNGARLIEGDSQITDSKTPSSLKEWLTMFWKQVKKHLGILKRDLEGGVEGLSLEEFTTAVATDLIQGNRVYSEPIKIQSALDISKIPALDSIKDSYNLSYVKEEDFIDIEAFLKEAKRDNKNIGFWVGDQLGRGYYSDDVINGEHFLDAGISYALDPEHRGEGIIWASGAPKKRLKSLVDKSDYIFIISGSPTKSKMFNKQVFRLFSERAGDFSKFKKGLLDNSNISALNSIIEKYDSWESLEQKEDRKKMLLLIEQQRSKGTDLNKFLSKNNLFLDYNSLRDGFLLENDFGLNDVMLVLRPTGVGGTSSHSTYETDILGEVVGIPDKKINAFDLLPLKKRQYTPSLNNVQQQQVVAPYGIGYSQVDVARFSVSNNNANEIEEGNGLVGNQIQNPSRPIPPIDKIQARDFGLELSAETQTAELPVDVSEITPLLEELNEKGSDTFLVGGSVRDVFLGQTPKDIDVEVHGLDIDELFDILSKYGKATKVDGGNFGIITFVPEGGTNLPEPYDFSIPRTEEKVSEGKSGFDITAGKEVGKKEAFKRRENTINAVGYNPITKELYNPYNGLNDLYSKTMDKVSDAFDEDPSRVVRAMQFQARFGLKPSDDLYDTMRSMVESGEVDTVPKELWGKNFMKFFKSGVDFTQFFEFLDRTGVGERYFPELMELRKTPQDSRWHPEGNVEEHTKQVMQKAYEIAERDGVYGDDRAVLMLSALLHDIAKPSTTEVIDGRITSRGHEAEGVEPAREFMEKLKVPNDIVNRVLPVVKEHLAHASIASLDTTKQKKSAYRKLQNRLEKGSFKGRIQDLLWLMESDMLGRDNSNSEAPNSLFETYWLKEQMGEKKPVPFIQGRDLIKRGLTPSPKFGKIIAKAGKLQDSQYFEDKASAEEWLNEVVEKDDIDIVEVPKTEVKEEKESEMPVGYEPKGYGAKRKSDAPTTALSETYKTRLSELKESNPEKYWALDMPSDDVIQSAAREGRLVDVNGGMGIVTRDGDMIGMFKYDQSATNTGASVQQARIALGGVKLDNYDGALTEIYKRNGFRVVSRTPFNEEFAPDDWNKEIHGTPDVVAMIYDPNNSLDIVEKTFDSYDEALAYRDSYISTNRSADTQDFFSDVVTGQSDKFKPSKPWTPLLSFTRAQERFKEIFDKYRGNFDNHIATSIPTFRETQIKVGNALTKMLPKGSLVYDIGGSEGGFVKSITESSNGTIESVNLDVNPEMKDVHESTPVEGSEFIQEAFYEGFDEYKKHTPSKKADVVHESMVFQFISDQRAGYVKEVAENYLKEDGIFLTEEKLLPESESEWIENEQEKAIYKNQYYSQQQLTQKSEEVLVGMKANQTSKKQYISDLKDNFEYVEEYWTSGNFSGILATNSKQKRDEFLKQLGEKIEYSPSLIKEEMVEPSLSYKTPSGQSYTSFQEALKNTESGNIEGVVDEQTIFSINADTSTNSFGGVINGLVKANLLTGTSILDADGSKVYETAGATETKKITNSQIIKDITRATFGRKNVKNTESSDFIFTEPTNNLVEYEGTTAVDKDDITTMDWIQLKGKYGEEVALELLSNKEYKKLFKGMDRDNQVTPPQEFKSEEQLQRLLIGLLNKMGVKITSISDYVTKFASKNGVEPSAQALADIGNKIVAFNEGEITIYELSEEVSHFIVEAWDKTEVANLLRNIHRTEQWQEHAENYRRIYSSQNPSMSEAQIDEMVRREVLGKVLADAFTSNFSQENAQGVQVNIIQKIKSLFNSFMEYIANRFKPSYKTELEGFTDQVMSNLLSDEIHQNLNLEQLEGNKLLMYSASSTTSDPLVILESQSAKALDLLESQDRKIAKNASKSEINEARTNLEKQDEVAKVKSVSGIISVAKKHVNYLENAAEKNKNKSYPFTQEENMVYVTTKGSLLGYLNQISNVLDTKDNTQKRLKKELDNVVLEINGLTGSLQNAQNNAWKSQVERVGVKLSLTETQKQYLLDAYIERTDSEGNTVGGAAKKDTNWFFAHISSMAQAQDPALNMASDIVSNMTTKSNIRSNARAKRLLNRLEKLGYKPKDLNKFKRGNYILSSVDWDRLDKEVDEYKTKRYNEIKGTDLSVEQFKESEKAETLNLSSEENVIFFEDVHEYRKSNHWVDILTPEARAAKEKMYEGLSDEVKRFDKMMSKQRGQISSEAEELGEYTKAHRFRLQELNSQRQKKKSAFDESGTLKQGLIINSEGEIVQDPNVQVLEADSQITLDLIELDKRRFEFFKEKYGESERSIPQKFYELLEKYSNDPDKQLETLLLNANLSFSNEFWDSLGTNPTLVQKLEEEGSQESEDLISRIREVQMKRSYILRKNKVYNQPSEVDYENMGGEEMDAIKEYTQQLQDLYSEAKAILTKQEELYESDAVTNTNQAYLDELSNQGIISVEQEFEFIRKHVTNGDVLLLESARKVAEDLLSGRRLKVSKFYESVFSGKYTGTKEEQRAQVYSELVEYSRGKLLPYFKRTEPKNVSGVSFSEVFEQVQAGIIPVMEFVQRIESGEFSELSLTPNYIFFTEEENSDINPEYKENERLGAPQIRKQYANKEYNETFNPDFEGNATTNTTDFEALQALMDYHQETLEATNMDGKHNKYLIPQMGMRSTRQFEKLIKTGSMNTFKEVWKDMTSYREDEKEYGESATGSALGAKSGDLRIPKYGFNKLENEADVTDELLLSYTWMGNEAEVYNARLDAFSEMEALKDLILNADYGAKSAESTNLYKMFDSFYRFNIYGQNETFSYETDFFGLLPKKMNIAPLAKKLQWWVRLVNLGFNMIVPLTSIMQGGVNLTIERFVGERLDKDAAAMARRKLTKLVTEAAGDALSFNSKSKLNSLAEFFGTFDLNQRFENSNYNKVTRGLLKSSFLTHTIADAPIKGQILLTVLHDFRVVDGNIMNYNQYKNQRQFLSKQEGESIDEKKIRSDWRAYEDNVMYNYMSVKDGITSWEKDKLKNDLGDSVSEEEFENFLDLKQQAVRDAITRTAQEVDTMIPSEERSVAQRHAIFSFFFLHRGWMSVAYNRKFKQRHLNLHTGLEEEGNWYGSAKFLQDMFKEYRSQEKTSSFLKHLKESWQTADDARKRSLHRTATELVMANSLAALALLLMGYADDDEESWAKQFGAYMGYRVSNEVISSTIAYPRQVFEFLESPVVGLDKIRGASDIFDMFSGDLVERGKYQGESERMKFVYKNLPAFKEYYNVHNAGKTRDTYEFYNRDNYNWTASSYFIGQNKEN